jgi:hypothetical protein
MTGCLMSTEPLLLGSLLFVDAISEQGHRLEKQEDQKYRPELDMSVLMDGGCR